MDRVEEEESKNLQLIQKMEMNETNLQVFVKQVHQ